MTKQLFPGVSEQDMENKEKQKQAKIEQERKRAEEIKKAAEKLKHKAEQEKKQKDFDKKVKYLYTRFGDFRESLEKEVIKFIGRQAIVLGVFYAMFGIGSAGDNVDDKGINLFVQNVSTTDRKAYDQAYSEGGDIKAIWAYITNPLKETYNFATLFDKDAYKKLFVAEKDSVDNSGDIVPVFDWRLVRAYVGLIAIILCAVCNIENIKEDKKIKTKYIREILTAWENNDFTKLDSLMNTIYSSDGVDVKGMTAKIISHLSKKDQAVFEKLITGEAKVSVKTAVAVMEGHLKAHPEDMKLVLNTFDEKSIPQEILAMQVQREKR